MRKKPKIIQKKVSIFYFTFCDFILIGFIAKKEEKKEEEKPAEEADVDMGGLLDF